MNEFAPSCSIFADIKDFAFDPSVSDSFYLAFRPSSGYITLQDQDRPESNGWGFDLDNNQDLFLRDGETCSLNDWNVNPLCLDTAWSSLIPDLSSTSLRREVVASGETTLAPGNILQDDEQSGAERAALTGRKHEIRSKAAATDVEQYTSTSTTREVIRGRKSTVRHNRATSLPREEKRKLSLEKNRMAAAQCRIKRKDRADLLQKNLQDQMLRNSLLKREISSMEEETRRLQSCLVSHSTSGGCNMPAEIHQVLPLLVSQHSTRQSASGEHGDGKLEVVSDSCAERCGLIDDRRPISLCNGYFQASPFLDVLLLKETSTAPRVSSITVGA